MTSQNETPEDRHQPPVTLEAFIAASGDNVDRHLILGAVLCLAALSACGSDSDADSDRAPGLANPASVFCEEQGGALEIETDDEGNQTGICVLPDGSRADEWEYYRGNNE